jgi:hypothetical protein
MSKNLEVLYLVDNNEINNAKDERRISKGKLSKNEGITEEFVPNLDEEEDLTQIKPIDFKFWDKLGWIKMLCHRKKTPKENYMSPTQLAFIKGQQKFYDEFNVF